MTLMNVLSIGKRFETLSHINEANKALFNVIASLLETEEEAEEDEELLKQIKQVTDCMDAAIKQVEKASLEI